VRDAQRGCGYAFLNDSSYSTSIKGGCVYQTVLRSPIYADHGGSRDGERSYTEQGVREFNYEMMAATADNAPIVRAARLLNAPLSNIIENWHAGKWADKERAGIAVSEGNVILSAIKRSEDGQGTVIRLYEVEGKDTAFTASGDVLPAPLSDTIGAYSVETYYLADGSSEWKKVLLTEYEE
jgi:alpha-mannosidase